MSVNSEILHLNVVVTIRHEDTKATQVIPCRSQKALCFTALNDITKKTVAQKVGGIPGVGV